MAIIPAKQIIGLSSVFRERLTIATQNTVPALTKTPKDSTSVKLFVNGIQCDSIGGSSADFSVSAKLITWSAANAGFPLDPTDKVTAEYVTTE